MSEFLTFVILCFVTYRVARFIVLDTLWDQWRDRLIEYLERPRGRRRRTPLWRQKLSELIGCPFCVTVWTGAGAIVLHHNIVEPLPAPVWWWVASSTGALIIWRWIDWEED